MPYLKKISKRSLVVIIVFLLVYVWAVFKFSSIKTLPPVKESLPQVIGVKDSVIASPTVNSKALDSTSSRVVVENNDTFLVTRVIDGDTIELENGQVVRYIGVDTPEYTSKNECYGFEATNFNRELVENKRVTLLKDVSETDRYGRLLRYVYVENIFVNDYLVRQGYANVSSYPPDVKYQSQFREAEKAARKNNRGLWSFCGKTAITSQEVVSSDVKSSEDCLIKGNISFSTGEKIYHIPGCKSYEDTQINTSKGEKWFCSEQEAINASWRKAKNCP